MRHKYGYISDRQCLGEVEIEGGNGTAAVSRKFMALFPGLFRLGEGGSFCY